MNAYKILNTRTLGDVTGIDHPDHVETLTENSPALLALTDFREQQPRLLEQSTPVQEAIELMKRSHEKLKLVIGGDESFRGVISLADLLSVKVMRTSQATGLARTELAVADVMTPRSALRAVDYSELAAARVGDLLATMQNYGDRYLLVIDDERGSLRGVIASSDIARGLHIPLRISERANTFSDIYQAIHA